MSVEPLDSNVGYGESNFITQHFTDVAAAATATSAKCELVVADAAEALVEIFRNQRKILICGNGGSASYAGHLAGEFLSSFRRGLARRALPAISLPDATAAMTAYANDFGHVDAFARQVCALGNRGDGLVAISTSGRSENVLSAAQAAKSRNMIVFALVGKDASPLSELAYFAIFAQSNDTQITQTIHIAIAHILCERVDEAFS